MSDSSPLFVICDHCRAEGLAGEDPFAAFGALLDFEPVPRRKVRADGWDADVQRAFVAALSVTGSRRQAARAVGKAQYGVDQLLACPGSEGFRAACDEAMAMAADERSRRLAEGLRTVAAEQAGWRPADPPWSKAATRAAYPESGRRGPGRPPAYAHLRSPPEPAEAEDPAQAKEAAREYFSGIVRKYLLKLGQERQARLEGRIATADFYVRQLTWLEVALDLTSGDGWKLLHDFRAQGTHLIDIAETPMSRILDNARRDHWLACGDPPRPEHPPRHLVHELDHFTVEPMEYSVGGIAESHEDQWAAFEAQHARDAKAQVEWEAEARRDYERRRDSDAAS